MKDSVERRKRQATDWEKISANHISEKEPYVEYIKNSQNSTVKTKPNQKIGKRYEETICQGGYRNGREAP